MKKLFFIFGLIAFVAIVFNGCKKDDISPDSNNTTNGKTTAVFNSSKTYGTMTDQDGNVYKTIVIGTQTWMAENLRTTMYRNGDPIPNVTDNAAWSALTTGAQCTYNNTENAETIATYGRLYNWYAVSDIRNIAPTGWHVPTDADWTTLKTYLGGGAGGKMKEPGITHWTSPNTGATNESGFTALPGGLRGNSGFGFYEGGDYTIWWSRTDYPPTENAWRYSIGSNNSLYDDYANKRYGFSVRCVKD